MIRQLLEEHQVGELVALDNNESELFSLEQRFAVHEHASFFLADVRDRDRLNDKMKGIDWVFHTAAFKHVVQCERSPFEAVQTNIIGVQNIIYAAIESNVERVVFTSSDKAVNPTNVMGTSKLMGERLITAANSNLREKDLFLHRPGLGMYWVPAARSSPFFMTRSVSGGPVTLTDPEMTRFIMSIEEAVQLVIDSGILCRGGEVFVTKMPAIRIKDLAEVMVEKLAPTYGHKAKDIEIQIIGHQPGEKLYEELLNMEETRRSWELGRYFVVLPAFREIYRDIVFEYPDLTSKEVTKAYHSGTETPLSKTQLAAFLEKNKLLKLE